MAQRRAAGGGAAPFGPGVLATKCTCPAEEGRHGMEDAMKRASRRRSPGVSAVETIRDGGHTAWFLRLRAGKYSSAVQPDPELLAWLYLDARGKPVGIKFLEPLPSPESTVTIVRAALARPGIRGAAGRDRLLRGMGMAARAMPVPAPCPAPALHGRSER